MLMKYTDLQKAVEARKQKGLRMPSRKTCIKKHTEPEQLEIFCERQKFLVQLLEARGI